MQRLAVDAQVKQVLQVDLAGLGSDGTRLLNEGDFFLLPAPLWGFLYAVMTYLGNVRPAAVLDFLLEHPPFLNILLRNSTKWYRDSGRSKDPPPGDFGLDLIKFELQKACPFGLHDLIEFDMENACAASRRMLELVVGFLNIALKAGSAHSLEKDVVLHAASLAALACRALLRENYGKPVEDPRSPKNFLLTVESEFPSVYPTPETLAALAVLAKDHPSAVLVLSLFKGLAQIESLRFRTGLTRGSPSSLCHLIFEQDLVTRSFARLPEPPSQKPGVLMNGSHSDLRLLYLELWDALFSCGLKPTDFNSSALEQVFLTISNCKNDSGSTRLIRMRAGRIWEENKVTFALAEQPTIAEQMRILEQEIAELVLQETERQEAERQEAERQEREWEEAKRQDHERRDRLLP